MDNPVVAPPTHINWDARTVWISQATTDEELKWSWIFDSATHSVLYPTDIALEPSADARTHCNVWMTMSQHHRRQRPATCHVTPWCRNSKPDYSNCILSALYELSVQRRTWNLTHIPFELQSMDEKILDSDWRKWLQQEQFHKLFNAIWGSSSTMATIGWQILCSPKCLFNEVGKL